MHPRAKDQLAIAGGKPVRTKTFPVKLPVIGKEERRNLLDVFDSGKWWYGEKVAEFEKKYAELMALNTEAQMEKLAMAETDTTVQNLNTFNEFAMK